MIVSQDLVMSSQGANEAQVSDLVRQKKRIGDVRILVVDDQRDMRELISDVLCAAGFDAMVVTNGLEAMRVIGADPKDSTVSPFMPVDVVITDLRMPVADGMDVLEAVRQKCPGVRTILVSAFVTEDVRLEAELHGADAVISKPFSLADLLGTLDEVLNR